MMKKSIIIKVLFFTFIFAHITGSKVNAFTLNRLYGNNRYQTAVSISKEGWTNSDYAIIVNGEDFPDALSASPLAAYHDAPILLSAKDAAPSETLNELNRLKVKKVLIIGGTGVVSDSVKASIESLKYDGQIEPITCDRIYGNDRYSTSVEVAKQLPNSGEIAALSGENFPDALSMAPFAAKNRIPIVLVSKSNVSPSLKNYISENSINRTYVIAGPGVIDDSVVRSFNNAERIYGQDRYETNAKVIQRFSDTTDNSKTFIASGENFPDALSGSVLAAKLSSPIVLTSKLPKNTTTDLINSNLNKISDLDVLGGSGVISPDTIQNFFVSKKLGNSSANTNNIAVVASRNGWIYTDCDSRGILVTKLDGSEEKILNVLDEKTQISITDKYIFYINENKHYRLYRTNLDGTDAKCIDSSDEILQYSIYDNYIYYSSSSDSYKLYRMNFDGGDKTKLTDDSASNINITDDYIFYTVDDASLCRINKDGSNHTVIRNSKCTSPIVWRNSIYFADENDNIAKMNLDGTNYQRLNLDKSLYLNIQGDTIYYTNGSDKESIYSISIDGTLRKCINNEPSYHINIAGNKIYYKDDYEHYKSIDIPEIVKETKAFGNERGNAVGSILNKAFVAQQGDYYYTVDGTDLYKVKMDGTEKKELTNYNGGLWLNISGDYIYYSALGIHKIRTDGTGNEILVTPDNAVNITLIGDWIYYMHIFYGYSDEGTICKVSTDGTKREVIPGTDRVKNMSVVNGWIYYLDVNDNYSVYKIRTDGTEKTKLYSASANNPVVSLTLSDDGSYAYIKIYQADHALRLSTEDGSEISIPNDMEHLIATQDRLFYTKSLSSNKIYSSNLDGSSEKSVAAIRAYSNISFNIIDNNLYYYDYDTQNKLQIINIK